MLNLKQRQRGSLHVREQNSNLPYKIRLAFQFCRAVSFKTKNLVQIQGMLLFYKKPAIQVNEKMGVRLSTFKEYQLPHTLLPNHIYYT